MIEPLQRETLKGAVWAVLDGTPKDYRKVATLAGIRLGVPVDSDLVGRVTVALYELKAHGNATLTAYGWHL